MDYNFLPRGLKDEFGWYNGRNLPHFDAGERAQFITIRLADSMPQELLERWRTEAKTDAIFRKRIERFLDNGYGDCCLSKPEIACMVQSSLLFHHEKKYHLHAWVIMPNHAHFLLRPLPGEHLDKILHSINLTPLTWRTSFSAAPDNSGSTKASTVTSATRVIFRLRSGTYIEIQ